MPGVLEENLALSLRGLEAGLVFLRDLGEQVKLSVKSSAPVTRSRDTSGEKKET